ncbi:MAG: response regulator transcription factor [Kiritimatiellia bacterium]
MTTSSTATVQIAAPPSCARAARRILIVDDQAPVRKSIRNLIELESSHLICGEAANEAQFWAMLGDLRPDFIIMDISLGGEDGLQLVRDLRRSLFTSDVLVLSMHAETLYALDALRSGANGYLMKADAAANIARAIQSVIGHKVYLSDYMWNLLRNLTEELLPEEAGRRLSGLRAPHRRVFHLLSVGLSIDLISQFLGLANTEVIRYCLDMQKVLGLPSLKALRDYSEASRKS